MFEEIKQTLEDFRVPFDVYFHENDLYESGATDRAIARLRELGNIYEQDGAVWLRTEKFGDDKDRVIVKSDGTAPTSPATRRTTSTSASAASTAASSCSAPTTTGTSAG